MFYARFRLMQRIPIYFILSFLVLFLLPGTAPAKETLYVGIFPFSPPLSFFASGDGPKSVRGYTVDECVMLGKKINAKIKFIANTNMEAQFKAMRKGKVCLIAHESRRFAAKHGLTFIPVGLSIHHHIYVNKSCNTVTCLKDLRDLRHKRVVVVKDAPYVTDVPILPSYIQAPSALEALHLLNEGGADVYIAPSERVSDYIIEEHGFSSVRKKGVVIGEAPLGFIANPKDKELISRVSTAIDYLERTGNLARIRDKWFGQTPSRINVKRFYKYITLSLLVVLSIFTAFFLWNFSLKRRVQQVANDLRRTEQRYRDLIESSPDMIFLVNEKGDILHANERARTFLLFPALPDKIQNNLSDIVAHDDVDEILAFLKKVFNDGCDKHEFIMQGIGGQPLEVETAGRVIQGPVQTELLACLFARNVTERNRMEEELIQSERLGIIGKMAASVAHEINNPLGIIQANAEDLLYEEGLSADVREGLSAIQRNAVRAGEITTGLLELASPKPMSIEPLDIQELMEESISLLGPKGKGQLIDINICDGPLRICGDSRALQQVIVNLLFNSLASMDNSGRIKITARQSRCPASPSVQITVKDKGKGIARENLPRIFEPFFTSRKAGFGLGLFITRRMIERHEGIIYAESEPGKGTCMTMEFPACKKDKE